MMGDDEEEERGGGERKYCVYVAEKPSREIYRAAFIVIVRGEEVGQ